MIVVGKLVFGIFVVLVEFECELIVECMIVGLVLVCVCGWKGGWLFKMIVVKLWLVMVVMGQLEIKVGDLCQEFGVMWQILYWYVLFKGELCLDGEKLFS